MTVYKTIDAKRRNNRKRKEALDAIRGVFGCSAIQAADRIREVLAHNQRLLGQVIELKTALREKDEVIAKMTGQ